MELKPEQVWLLTYKSPQYEVKTGAFIARDQEDAIWQARTWCSKNNCRFLRVEPFFLFTQPQNAIPRQKPPEPENYDSLTIAQVKHLVENGELWPEQALQLERQGPNRKSLVEWLVSRIAT